MTSLGKKTPKESKRSDSKKAMLSSNLFARPFFWLAPARGSAGKLSSREDF